MPRKSGWLVGLLSVCFGLFAGSAVQAQFAGAEPVSDALKVGYDSITPEQAKEFLSVLAGPQFKGRGTGQAGYTKAAHWIAGKVAEYGLEPRGEGGTYFQMLPMVRLSVDAADSALTGPKSLKIACDGSIGLDRFADQSLVNGKVTFLQLRGANATLPDDLDLRERVVVFVTDEANAGRAPFLIARKGPALTLRVVEQPVASSSQLLRRDGRQRSTSASGTITRAAANELLKAVDGEAAWLETPAEDGEAAELETPAEAVVAHHPTDVEVALSLRIREESAAVPNVIAWLEGSDPALKDEYMVIGAHLDHLGERGGNVYYGADDNGSGSTAILSIARAMSLNAQRPKRSVLFIWFAAEEMGLVGSRHYTDAPTLPLDKMICMLNIDMVGRNEEKEGETAAENEQTLHLIGSKQGQTELHDIIMAANRHVNFTFEYDEEGVFGRSDQASFYNKGVAVAFLFGGFHSDYHQPTDELARIDFDKIASAGRLFYLTAFGVAEHGRIVVTKPEPK